MLAFIFIGIPVLILILLYFQLIYIPKLQSIQGKHVIITGGSSGIGKAAAIECVKRGAHVTILARNQQKLLAAQNEIKQFCIDQNQKVHAVQGDVTKNNEIKAIIERIDQELPVFMLINCAGMALYAVLEEMSEADINLLINLNLMGTIYPTRAVMGLMKSRGEGIIVITASQGALLGVYGGAAYTASKYALRGLAEVLYYEGKAHNVSVTLCLPSDTDTPGFENEQKTKPIETKLICEQGGLLDPKIVGKQLVIDALRKRFYSYNPNVPTFCLTISAAGMSPITSWPELFLQVLLLGVMRIVAIFYIKLFESIIFKCKKNRDSKKKET